MAEFAIGGAVHQDVVGDHEEAVGHRDGRRLLPALTVDPVGLGAQVARGVACCPRRLGEGYPKLLAAFPGLARFPLARPLGIARAKPGPGGAMPVGGELSHVDPKFGHEDLRRPLLDHAASSETVGLWLVGRHQGEDHGVEVGDGPVEELPLGQLVAQDGPLHRGTRDSQGNERWLSSAKISSLESQSTDAKPISCCHPFGEAIHNLDLDYGSTFPAPIYMFTSLRPPSLFDRYARKYAHDASRTSLHPTPPKLEIARKLLV